MSPRLRSSHLEHSAADKPAFYNNKLESSSDELGHTNSDKLEEFVNITGATRQLAKRYLDVSFISEASI
jgi:hypothetical protein